MTEKINLIYVISNGRSGSTLLDMLVGKHKSCYTLGEFQMLPIDYKYNTQPCGCSKKIEECELWSEVYKNNRDIINNGSISRFRNFGFGKILRWNELVEVYFNKRISDNSNDIIKYGEENNKVMKSILRILNDSNIEYFVDASKDSYRLKWLSQSGYFNLKVLHIIKEPESFVYSMIKKEPNYFKRLYLSIRFALRWIIENSIIIKISKKYVGQDNYYKVKYETLSKDVDNQMNQVFTFLDVDNKNISYGGFKYDNHAISGNFMRFKTTKIKLDEKWKKEMNILNKMIVKIITIPFNRIYK